MNDSKDALGAASEPVLNCPCTNNCSRHGFCADCRNFHATSSRIKLPYCEREVIRPKHPID